MRAVLLPKYGRLLARSGARFVAVLWFIPTACGGGEGSTELEIPTGQLYVAECCRAADQLTARVSKYRNSVTEVYVGWADFDVPGVLQDVTDEAIWTNETPSALSLAPTPTPCTNQPSRMCRRITNLDNAPGTEGRIAIRWKSERGSFAIITVSGGP